jgi:hypothetical protein
MINCVLLFHLSYSSSSSDCKSNIPFTYTWTAVGECVADGSAPINTDDPFAHGTVSTGCTTDTKSSIYYYHDFTCENAVKTVTSSFDQCMPVFSSDATNNNPSFANYKFGDCLKSSSASSNSADDDELSMSQADYAGSISGALIGGMVFGIIVTLIVGIVCLKCGSTKKSDGLNEKLVD